MMQYSWMPNTESCHADCMVHGCLIYTIQGIKMFQYFISKAAISVAIYSTQDAIYIEPIVHLNLCYDSYFQIGGNKCLAELWEWTIWTSTFSLPSLAGSIMVKLIHSKSTELWATKDAGCVKGPHVVTLSHLTPWTVDNVFCYILTYCFPVKTPLLILWSTPNPDCYSCHGSFAHIFLIYWRED